MIKYIDNASFPCRKFTTDLAVTSLIEFYEAIEKEKESSLMQENMGAVICAENVVNSLRRTIKRTDTDFVNFAKNDFGTATYLQDIYFDVIIEYRNLPHDTLIFANTEGLTALAIIDYLSEDDIKIMNEKYRATWADKYPHLRENHFKNVEDHFLFYTQTTY